MVIGFYHHKADSPLKNNEVEQTAQKYGMEFPVAFDPNWQTLKRWWLTDEKRKWTSDTFLIDKKGVIRHIRHIHPGGQYVKGDSAYEEMSVKIKELLKERNRR
jgi:peroxiredoxin